MASVLARFEKTRCRNCSPLGSPGNPGRPLGTERFAMDKSSYQVVLTGGLISGFSREAVLVSLARLFQTSAARLVEVIDGDECPIDDLLEADQAAKLQQRLERMGVRTRIERIDRGSQPLKRSGLHLLSLTDPAEAGLMSCPACGHQQLVAKRCDECGVVFAEFNRRRVVEPGSSRTAAPSSALPKPQVAPRPRDIHANSEWHEEWMDDGNELPTEQYHINIFMGAQSAHLSTLCQGMVLGRRTRWQFSWAGGAMFSPYLWAMYRKMWGWGAVIFLTEILIPVLLITLGSKEGVSDALVPLGIGLAVANRVFWPGVLKFLYCRYARNTIMFMNRAAATTYASDIEIANRGGTSRTSAFVGLVVAVVVSLLAWSTVDTLHARWLQPAQPFATQGSSLDNLPPLPPVPAVPGVSETGTAPTGVGGAQRELPLVNQNNWVSTRNRLRVLGRLLSAWFAEGGRDQDPAQLDLEALARVVPLEPDLLKDGWGRLIVFESDGTGYRLISPGPDGEPGNSDDVDYRRILNR